MGLVSAMGLICLMLPALATTAEAGEADILAVRAYPEKGGTWRFDVTVYHADEGWNHYADGWEVLGPKGELITKRTLLHPHLEENPFTRNKTGVEIPAGTQRLSVRAHDKIHGHGGAEMTIDLSKRPAIGVATKK